MQKPATLQLHVEHAAKAQLQQQQQRATALLRAQQGRNRIAATHQAKAAEFEDKLKHHLALGFAQLRVRAIASQSHQRRLAAAAVAPVQAAPQRELFPLRETMPFGAKARPQLSAAGIPLVLSVQDPRTPAQRAADQLKKEEELNYSLLPAPLQILVLLGQSDRVNQLLAKEA